MKYTLLTYDVWGNEKDGYEVNNTFSTGTTIELPTNASDKDIKRALRSYYPNIMNAKLKIEGDDTLICIDRDTQRCTRPLCELRVSDQNELNNA